MKISFILPYAELTGGTRVVSIYADHLKRLGHEVTAISVPQRPYTLKRKIRLFLKNFIWPSLKQGASHLDYVDVEHKVLEKFRPVVDGDVPDGDVVIATWWETAEWVEQLHPSKGVKFYFIQGYDVREGASSKRIKETYLMPLKKIVISRWLENKIKALDKKAQLTYIPNSVDYNLFYSPKRVRQKTPTVGFIYSSPNFKFKGTDIVVQAINIALQKITHLKTISFGTIEVSEDLPLPEGGEYFRIPSQDKIREIYCSCDLWLFGSRAEGFGLPILEAMACRTPVIATRAGAAAELLEGTGGALLDDYEPKSMAEAIISYFSMSEEEWGVISQKSYDKARSYSWEDAAHFFEKALYDEMLPKT